MSTDHNTTQRRAEFGLGSTMENERRGTWKHRIALWLVIAILSAAFVAIGTGRI
jgi:hypothetical protein